MSHMLRMMMMSLVAGIVLTGCGDSGVEILKSPCVGIDDSPCGPKRPVNDWWRSQQKHIAYHALA